MRQSTAECIVRFSGDLASHDTVRVIAQLPNAKHDARVVLDLRDVSAIDASVIDALNRYRNDVLAATGAEDAVRILSSPELRGRFGSAALEAS